MFELWPYRLIFVLSPAALVGYAGAMLCIKVLRVPLLYSLCVLCTVYETLGLSIGCVVTKLRQFTAKSYQSAAYVMKTTAMCFFTMMVIMTGACAWILLSALRALRTATTATIRAIISAKACIMAIRVVPIGEQVPVIPLVVGMIRQKARTP